MAQGTQTHLDAVEQTTGNTTTGLGQGDLVQEQAEPQVSKDGEPEELSSKSKFDVHTSRRFFAM